MGKITSKKSKTAILTAEQQEETLKQIYQSETEKTTQRFTIDLPLFIYNQMKEETEMTGQTKKGFVLGLIRDHFTKKAASNREGG